MSKEYEGQDPMDIARQAERDLNSNAAKQGINSGSASTEESGVDDVAASRFPGSEVKYGSEASGQGDNRDIPEDEGGVRDGRGRLSKAGDFEGEGGPEEKAAAYAEENPGNDDVRDNIRQGGDTRRPGNGGAQDSY